MLRYDCQSPFLGRFAFRFRFPIPFLASFPLCSISGSQSRLEATCLRQGSCFTPVPLIFWLLVERKQLALSSSRTTPVDTCPARRPRWCPAHSPFLFVTRPAAFQHMQTVGYLILSTTIIPISGLSDAACILAPSSSILLLPGLHVDFATGLLARL